MAFHSLRKWFSRFRKKPYVDQIQAYRKLRWHEWFDSLSPEQQEEYKRRKQKERDKVLHSLNMLMSMTNALLPDNYRF